MPKERWWCYIVYILCANRSLKIIRHQDSGLQNNGQNHRQNRRITPKCNLLFPRILPPKDSSCKKETLLTIMLDAHVHHRALLISKAGWHACHKPCGRYSWQWHGVPAGALPPSLSSSPRSARDSWVWRHVYIWLVRTWTGSSSMKRLRKPRS